MRKLILVAAALLPLSVALPAFSQGVQTPYAPNATPPVGTVPNASSGAVPRVSPARHHRRARRHAVTALRPAEQVASEQQSL